MDKLLEQVNRQRAVKTLNRKAKRRVKSALKYLVELSPALQQSGIRDDVIFLDLASVGRSSCIQYLTELGVIRAGESERDLGKLTAEEWTRASRNS